jgi:hypothetical protein
VSRHSVICSRCGAQRAVPPANEGRDGSGPCPGCPVRAETADGHPCVVHFAWWPDFPEAAPDARRVWTATCGCGWGACAGDERSAWVAAFDHRGVLAAWRARPVIERPQPDAGPRDRRRMRYEIEAARLPGVPLRTLMACVEDGGGRRRHACRGVVPAGPGPAELCACRCHAEPDHDPDPCQHCRAVLGHRGSCPTWGSRVRTGHDHAEAQLTLFE